MEDLCHPCRTWTKWQPHFQPRSPTKAIPIQCCACIFPLEDVAEEKIFSVILERGNNSLLFRHYSAHSLLAHDLQFLHKLITIW